LCMLYDKHPSTIFLPCEGVDWTPKSSSSDNEGIDRC